MQVAVPTMNVDVFVVEVVENRLGTHLRWLQSAISKAAQVTMCLYTGLVFSTFNTMPLGLAM